MNHPDTLPDPDAFRAWLQDALTRLGLHATGYGPKIGLGKNTLRHFLREPGRDLTLGTAARIARDLRARARAEKVELPALPRPELDGGADD